MFVMMTTQAIVDFFSTYIKYSEGFVVIPQTGHIIQKPYVLWTPENQKPIQPMNYLQCVTFAFHTSVFFLMQCFWNYLSNSVAKKSFMGSFEFKFYIIWALASVAMFPVLQWRFRDDEYKSEIVPQLAYGGEVLLTAALGIRSNFRFKRIIAASRRNKSSATTAIVNRLSYFKEMNIILTIVLFIYGACFVILCADGLTEGMAINTNKFACDLLIANVNMCIVLLWLLFISIFHPRRNMTSPTTTSHSKSGQESGFQQSKNDMEMTTTAATTTNNSRPLSQRITNFMSGNGNNSQPPQQYGSEKYQQPSSPDQQNGGVFMRAMSPVNVDYPPSIGTEAAPLTASPAPVGSAYSHNHPRNVSIEDPYSSQSIVFSMVDPRGQQSQTPSTRYPTPTNSDMDRSYDYPMHTIPRSRTNAASPLSPTYREDERSEFDVSDYHDDTVSRQVYHATTNNTMEPAPPGRERMVTDWLYQSPERK
ncbi:hypothetical protein BJV82DRAFT_367682 [Fennellomyces sp. T-0311]|nr:hypothetical protein BJV82DRAFT_367682 [Fennellomyces sp. T-0311]